MNTIKKEGLMKETHYKLKDLVGKEGTLSSKPTAFIGKCGNGDEGLYLITYESIFFASNPREDYWDYGDCLVIVKRFVDVEISVIN